VNPLSCFSRRTLIALVALGLSACVDAQPAGNRLVVRPPTLKLDAASLQVAPGGTVTIKAEPGGGEAILFHVDWQLAEGERAGRIEATDKRDDNGAYAAVYKAPATAGGPWHLNATLREIPSVRATVEIRVAPK
jgi:hypothetical protein